MEGGEKNNSCHIKGCGSFSVDCVILLCKWKCGDMQQLVSHCTQGLDLNVDAFLLMLCCCLSVCFLYLSVSFLYLLAISVVPIFLLYINSCLSILYLSSSFQYLSVYLSMYSVSIYQCTGDLLSSLV